MILGRVAEKEILDLILQSKKAEFVAVFGRRRVGKTYLVRQYLKQHIVFDFTGSNLESNISQLANFDREFANQCVENHQKIMDWSHAFLALTQYLKTLDASKKAVIFLDELPWLDKPKAGFLGALQFFWNQHASQLNHVILVVCGSVASWIIKNITNSTGGLYNRVTQKIELKPFSLAETRQFLEYKNIKFTPFQITQLYMVMGGIPFYLDMVKAGKSIHQNIDELCFSKNGGLQNEFKMLYHSLFKQAQNHINVVEVLAKHHYGLNRKQLATKTKIPMGGSFNRVVDSLLDCGFIIENPSFGKKNKESTIRLIDFYSVFYLKYIQPNQQQNSWQNIQQSQNFEAWCGYAFENIAFCHTQQICTNLGIAGVYTQISSWQQKANETTEGAQIDLIIDRKDGIIHLFECKFSASNFVLTKEYATKLRQKRAIFKEVTKTKKMVVNSLLTSYSATKNEYYLEEIFNDIPLEALFQN